MGLEVLTSILRPNTYIGRMVAYGALELDGVDVGLSLGLGIFGVGI